VRAILKGRARDLEGFDTDLVRPLLVVEDEPRPLRCAKQEIAAFELDLGGF